MTTLTVRVSMFVFWSFDVIVSLAVAPGSIYRLPCSMYATIISCRVCSSCALYEYIGSGPSIIVTLFTDVTIGGRKSATCLTSCCTRQIGSAPAEHVWHTTDVAVDSVSHSLRSGHSGRGSHGETT